MINTIEDINKFIADKSFKKYLFYVVKNHSQYLVQKIL